MSDPLGTAAANVGPASNEVAYWLRELSGAKDREQKYREEAAKAVRLYEAQDEASNTFNILFSNTETLLPAVYNQLPRPSVRRRYNDDDAAGKAVAEVVKRGLEYVLDTPDTSYTPCDSLFEEAVLGALVPGRGILRWRYDPEFASRPRDTGNGVGVAPPAAGSGPEPGGNSPTAPEGEGAVTAGSSGEPEDQSDITPSSAAPAVAGMKEVVYEAVCGVSWPYDRFLQGFARRWSDVPWVAYEHRMTKADVKDNFGSQWVGRLTFRSAEPEANKALDSEETKGAPKTAVVWEIWHKSRRTVIFIAEEYKDAIVKRVKDPLGIPGFYDCTPPLQFVKRNSNLVPVVPYRMYEQQAKELNRITQRIDAIISAIKVRGFYNGNVSELRSLLTEPDNTLIASANAAALLDQGGLEKAIWLMPIEKLITVLQQLYIQRQQVKDVIYEITGISDIIRGATQASETATAQQIKNQWGTLRLKRMQKAVQKYIRDCLRIQAAIMCEHFGPKTWAAMTRLPYVQPEEKQAAQAAMAQYRMQALQAQAQTQAQPSLPGMPPQPPQQPQIPPEVQQAMASAQQTLATPDWGQIVVLLKDNLNRGYTIDVETNSTIDPDATEDRQNVTDFMGAMAQFGQTFEPLVQSQILPLAAVKAMLLAITRRFAFGPDVEDALKQIPDQMPQQQGADPTTQGKMQLMQIQVQVAQKEADIKMALMDKEVQIKEAELEIQQEELNLKRQELDQKTQLNQIQHTGKMQAAQAKMAMAAAGGGLAPGGGGPAQAQGPAAETPDVSIDLKAGTVNVGGKRRKVVKGPDGRVAGLEPAGLQ